MRRAYRICNRFSAELSQTSFRYGRAAVVAAVAAFGFMYVANLQAQSADDLKRQEVIAQRNADAAGAASLKRMASAPSATASAEGPAASVPTGATAAPAVSEGLPVMPNASSGPLNSALLRAASVPAPTRTATAAAASASGRTRAEAPAQASEPTVSPTVLVVKAAAPSTSEVATAATTLPARIAVQTAARATRQIVAPPVAASKAPVANAATLAPPPAKPAPTMQPMKPSAQTVPPATQPMPVPLVGTATGAITVAPRQAVVSEVKPQPKVKYVDGLLSIQANDASLNQILRQVSQLTGMVIAGGVAEERVFGNYGPARPSTVIAKLLDGIGSNMMLREGPNATVAELILTPRNGGVTPPRPSTIAAEPSETNEAQVNLQAQAGLAAARMRAESRAAAAAAYHPGQSAR